MHKKIIFFFISALIFFTAQSQGDYPYSSKRFVMTIEGRTTAMSYMDVQPVVNANGQTIVLLHGKNFNGYYWKDVIPLLTQKGYRVIVPDQLGWGKSARPVDVHYSFHMLSAANKALLDSLHLNKVIILGHSMGGMLAIRFAIMYPAYVDKLILEDPIGLEDYKTFVPYRSIDELYQKEKLATYESYKKYQQGYYPEWKPEYEQYVKAQAEDLGKPDFDKIARVNAITYQMIYEQPVVYELNLITVPTLLMVGSEDRTVVGKEYMTDDQKKVYGQYPALGKKAADMMHAKLVELPGMGHIAHVQNLELFMKTIMGF
jgi:pimeloyl-ACP methyl ester carboxylesterase